MPFDAQPLASPELTGFMSPREVAEITPAGTVQEPVFAAVIEMIREITHPEPVLPR